MITMIQLIQLIITFVGITYIYIIDDKGGIKNEN